MSPGQETIRRHTDGIDIGWRSNLFEVANLLRWHVCDRARDITDHRHAAHSRLLEALRQSEIRQLGDIVWIVSIDKYVLFLDVAVNEALAMSKLKCRECL